MKEYFKKNKSLLNRSKNTSKQRHSILGVIYALIFISSGCATVQQPMGGPKDVTPPKILAMEPENFQTHFKAEEIAIAFDEYIKLKNEFTEISITPAIDNTPLYKIKKRTLHVTFQDTLEDNTTYAINFGNAIVDFNEGNELKNFSYVFSTGAEIDSLSISGKVTNAETLEPETDITVLLIPLAQDSIFGKQKANIFTRTDSAGSFALKNLKEGEYKIYGLKETNNDRIYNNPDEMVAFLPQPIILQKDTANLKLTLFKEIPDNFRILSRELNKQGRITLAFNKALENPEINILENPPLDTEKQLVFSSKKDTAFLWLPAYEFDSLKMEITADNSKADTTILKRNKKDEYEREITINSNLQSRLVNKIDQAKFQASAPVNAVDATKITLLEDSVRKENFTVKRSEELSREFQISYNWKKDTNYDIKLENGAVSGHFSEKSKEASFRFTYDDAENYGDIILHISSPDSTSSYLIQLLNDKNLVLSSRPITGSTTLTYKNLPGIKYKVRVVYDSNNNQKWDTGSIKEKRQPEKVWFWDKIISIRPNWEQEDTITIPAL